MSTTDNGDLMKTLEADGLSDSLRAQLRAQVVRKVKGQSPRRPHSPLHELVASLFCDYLRAAGFEYTLTVFLPEAGVSGKALSGPELRERLQIETGQGTVIEDLVRAYHRALYKSDALEVAVQTQNTDLDLQLQLIETHHKVKLEQQPKPAQEHLLALERECRERYQTQLTREIAHIRSVETAAVRVEEARKYQESLSRTQKDFESRWRQKLEELKEREREMSRLQDAKEREMTGIVSEHKLQVEKDTASLQRKEGEIADNIGATLSQLKTQQATYERLNFELEAKTKEMDLLKASFERRCAEELQHLQREFEQANFLQKQQIMVDREETDRLRQSTEFEISSKRDSELRIVALTRELDAIRRSYSSAAEELASHREEVKELREHISIVTDRAKRNGDLLTLKEMTIESLKSEVRTHKESIDRLKETMQRLKQEVAQQPVNIPAKAAPRNSGPIDSSSDLGLNLAAWKVERESCWRELDVMEADIKRKFRDEDSVPTQRFRDAYSAIVIPKKAVLPVETNVHPRVKTLDSAEVRQQAVAMNHTTRLLTKQVSFHGEKSHSSHHRENAQIEFRRPVEDYQLQHSSSSRRHIPLQSEAKEPSPRMEVPAVVENRAQRDEPAPTVKPPVNDSIIEEIVIDPDSSSSHKHVDDEESGRGYLLESESLEAPSVHTSEEEQFF